MPGEDLRSSLTIEDVRELVRVHMDALRDHEQPEFRELVRDPNMREATLQMVLAIDAAMNILGSVRGGGTTFRYLSGGEFFLASEGLESQFRIQRFGEALFNLQSVPGFEDWLSDFPVVRERELSSMLAGRFAEVDAACLMCRAGVLRRLRSRRNRPREDYDCELVVDDVEVAAEIKAKLNTTKPSVFAFKDTVEKARDQLPTDKPGVVWVKVPQSWVHWPVAQLNVEMAMVDIRKAPGQLFGVVVHWEEFDGLVARVMFNLMPVGNDAERVSLARALDHALETSPAAGSWVRFASVVHDSVSSANE